MARMGRPRGLTDEEILGLARRRFLERGAQLPLHELAAELGTSHTTLLNRFGSKDELMVKALAPPREMPWVALLNAGPDERPFREQLEEMCGLIATHFGSWSAGLACLRAAGIGRERLMPDGKPPDMEAIRKHMGESGQALVDWLGRAQQAGMLAPCDTTALASALMGSLRAWTHGAYLMEGEVTLEMTRKFVSELVGMLWHGIAPVDKRGRAS